MKLRGTLVRHTVHVYTYSPRSFINDLSLTGIKAQLYHEHSLRRKRKTR